MQPKNPRRPDGDWRFRSKDEETAFRDQVKRLGQNASPEELSRIREEAAFEEDERIRESMGMGRKRPAPSRIGFEQQQLMSAVRAYIQKLEHRRTHTATIELPTGAVQASMRETRAPRRPKPDWLDGLGGTS
ncbi:MAG: hypothetical protein WCB10_12035 [Steroidobacteraceae bacterium]